VVGALLVFSLMVGPPAAARLLVTSPGRALVTATTLSLTVLWSALVAAYWTNWPVGFFVAVGSATIYLLARLITARR